MKILTPYITLVNYDSTELQYRRLVEKGALMNSIREVT